MKTSVLISFATMLAPILGGPVKSVPGVLTVLYTPKAESVESAEKAAARAAAVVVAPDSDWKSGGTVQAIKRQSTTITHVYVCDSVDWQGRCQNLDTIRGVCSNLYAPFQDSISSFGPDKGTTCSVYENYNCGGRHIDGIVYPGIPNLVPPGFNDIISSYRCS